MGIWLRVIGDTDDQLGKMLLERMDPTQIRVLVRGRIAERAHEQDQGASPCIVQRRDGSFNLLDLAATG